MTIKIEKRTWYGINATIITGSGFLHTAGFGFFLIPHPPVVNWLLRRKLTKGNRLTLTRVHEFQHLQSAPFILIYMLLFFAFAFVYGRVGLMESIIVLVSCQALWEITAEVLTIASDTQFYHNAYENISILPRVVFWIAVFALTIAGGFILLKA